MDKIFLFLLIISLTSGTPAILLTQITYKNNKNKTLLYLLFFYTTYTILISFGMFTQFNFLYNNIFFTKFEVYNGIIFTFLRHALLFSHIIFGHALFNVKNSRRKNLIIIFVILFLFISRFLNIDQIYFYKIVNFKSMINLLPEFIKIYFLITGFMNASKIDNSEERKFSIRILFLFSFMIITNILYFLNIMKAYILQPLYYSTLGVFIILFTKNKYFKYIGKNFGLKTQLGHNNKLDNLDITKREKEVIMQVLKGKSNKDISESLYITEYTVKFHLQKIYKKFDIKSRYELITLISSNSVL